MTYDSMCRNQPYGCQGTADSFGSGYCDGCEIEEICPHCQAEEHWRCSECDGCSACCVCPCYVCSERPAACRCDELEEMA